MRVMMGGVLVVVAAAFIAFSAVINSSFPVSTWSAWLIQAKIRDQSVRSTSVPSSSTVQRYRNKELLYHVGQTLYFSPSDIALANLTLHWPGQDGSDDDSRQLAATVVRVPAPDPNAPPLDVRALLEKYLAADDVLSREWLYTLFFTPSEDDGVSGQLEFDRDTLESLARDFGTRQVVVHPALRLPVPTRLKSLDISIVPLTAGSSLPDGIKGPVLITTTGQQAQLWPVYRLYSDTYRAFLYGMYPTSPFPWSKGSSYRALRAVDDWGYSLIPVPSRLYGGRGHTAASGKRIAVKDVYDIKGVVTSAGSRPYGQVLGEAERTASSILRLEELGGQIIGKTKTAAFAVGSIGNPDTVDEQYPFSARGDGWQTCSGSSSGSACAMGAYDWLDFAIGTDTGGSVRHPASIVGLYGGRPSTGALPMDGVVPLSNFSDTAGAFGRDPRSFAAFLQAWYAESPMGLKRYPELPKSLLVATEYAKQASPEAQAIVDAFIVAVQDKLSMVAHPFDLDQSVFRMGYSKAQLRTLFNDTVESNSLWTWTRNGRSLQERYRELNGGRYAPMDPEIRAEWEYAENHGNWTLYDDTARRLRAFGEDFNGKILGADEASCSKSILLYDIGTGGIPLYREDELNRPFNRNVALSASRICPWAGCVDYTVPIGQVPYRSAISRIDEQKAVTISLVAHRACDFMMLAFVERLAEMGLIGPVQTGREAFPLT